MMNSRSSDSITLRDAKLEDLPAILEIYNEAILNSTATFDLEPNSIDSRRTWFLKHNMHYPLVIAEIDGKVAGYCCISPYAEKKGYARTVDLSVYVHKEYRRKGVATALMNEIISRARSLGYHAIVSSISSSNHESVSLHKKFGFEFCGCLRQLGYKFGEWQDVSYYELLM